LLVGSLFISCGPRIANRDSIGRTIICFGNSITEGVGAGAGQDYPSHIQQMTDVQVINAGVAGDTTGDGLKRIETDVLGHNPKIVIVEFGANDFLKKIPKEETFKNMELIVQQLHNNGVIVVVAVVRTGILTDSYVQGFQDIAKKYRALLIPDILRGILTNPKLKYDQIHPNSEGYKIIAERIYQNIKPFI